MSPRRAADFARGPRGGETLEYSDHQRAAFRDAYSKRFRNQLMMLVLLFLVTGAFAFTGDDTFLGFSEAFFGSLFLVASLVFAIFGYRNWRCPACGEPLGRGFNPKHCRRCGIELRA